MGVDLGSGLGAGAVTRQFLKKQDVGTAEYVYY